jgi:GTP cyclohydrolase IV
MAPAAGPLELRHVGIESILKPLNVERHGRVRTLTATFGITVDLPASRKGSDLSRNAELLAELVDRTATHPVSSLEAACSEVARELLVRHTYARRSSVRASAPYFLPRGFASGRASLESFVLFAEAHATRSADDRVELRRSIGAEAVGMTACPCAMETVRDLLVAEYPPLADPALAGLPILTHNQRNRTRLSFEIGEADDVEADELIDAIEAAQSSPTFDILKRGDEARAVLSAHRAPKFVEDVLRDLLSALPARFPRLPDAVAVRAETTSEESIHKYDVVAAHETTLGELRHRSAS